MVKLGLKESQGTSCQCRIVLVSLIVLKRSCLHFVQMTTQTKEYVTKFDSLESQLFGLASDFGETLQEFETTTTTSSTKAFRIPVPAKNSGVDGNVNCLVDLFQIAAEKLQVPTLLYTLIFFLWLLGLGQLLSLSHQQQAVTFGQPDPTSYDPI